MAAHTAMGGGGGGDFQGPTYKSKLPDPGRSCQQSLVFNLQKKSEADCKAVRLYHSFLHFVKNGMTSSGNDWS